MESDLKETQEALEEAYEWLQNRYKDFGERTGLTPEIIRSRFNLQGLFELPNTLTVNTDQGHGEYVIFDFEKEIPSDFGPASLIRLVRLHPYSAPVGAPEGMMVMTPVDDYTNAIAISQGWKQDESEILYMMLGGVDRIKRITQVTKPGVLFPCPGLNISLFRQEISLDFGYLDGRLTHWDGELNVEAPGIVKMFFSSFGERILTGEFTEDSILPSEIDVAAVIRNIIAGRPAINP